MAEKLTRVSYVEPNGRARQDKTGNTESRVDMERYVQPLHRMHAAGLHDWGIAEGLAVSATVGDPDVRVSPGLALDATGRHIALAAGGKARLDDQTTTVVGETGVVLATAGLTGPHLVTAAWAETFDRPTFTTTGAFQNDDTPLLRIRAAADVPGDGTEIVLATVELDDDSTVGALSADGRRTTGITVERLGFRVPTSGDTVSQEESFRLTADDSDGVPGLRVYNTIGATDELIFSVLADGRLDLTAGLTSPLEVPSLTLEGLLALATDGDYLHLNRDEEFASGVYTPRATAGILRLNGIEGMTGAAALTVVDSSQENTWNTAAFTKPAIGPHWSHIHWGATGDWYIRSAATEGKVVIQDHTGLVGVGLGNPIHNLDVNANIGLNGLRAVSNWNDGYLRLNQDGAFGNGVHTPSTLSSYSVNVGGYFSWGDPGRGNVAVAGRVSVGTEDMSYARISAVSDGTCRGIIGVGSNGWEGLRAHGSPNAAMFFGDVRVSGTIFKSRVQFQLDHPLDPENRYLSHSAVESDEMKNVYDGETTLDADGTATIELPDWFEALNERFRYQLTPIGTAAPNLHVSRPLSGNAFAIAGGPAGGLVCWQVTGVRHDAYAVAHPLEVEADKDESERGRYWTPEAFGEPASRGIGYAALHPGGG